MNRGAHRAVTGLALAALALAGCGSAALRQATDGALRRGEGSGGLPPAARDYGGEPAASGEPAAGNGNGTVLPALAEEGGGLEDYLREAALHNPGLEAAFNEWKAALERVPQVKALPDPRFTYRYYIREVETRVGPQRHALGIAQVFPWFGKLSLRGDVAMEAAHAARQRYEARKLALFRQVKDAYAEYWYLSKAIEVVRENRDLMKYLESVARARFAVGAATHSDVIRAQVELGTLDDRLRTLQDLRGALEARLNALLDRPTLQPLPWPRPIEYEPVAATDEELLAGLAEANPELKALDHETAARQHVITLARKEYFPDVTLGMDYIETGPARMPGTRDSGKDPVSAMVSVNVPIWHGKYAAGVREAQAQHWAALKAKADRRNQLGADLTMIVYRLRDAERKTDLYGHTLVPKAQEALKTTETAFAAGRATFSDLVDAERVFLEFRLLTERARADHAQRLAELEALIGRPVPRRSPPGAPPPAEPAAEPAAQAPEAGPPAGPPVPIERGPAPQPPPFELEPPAAPGAPTESPDHPKPGDTGKQPAKGEEP